MSESIAKVNEKFFEFLEYSSFPNGFAILPNKLCKHLLIDDKFSAIHTQHIPRHPLCFRMTEQSNDFGHIFGSG